MTAVAGTTEYAREYQRRRSAGLPTKGLAEELRAQGAEPQARIGRAALKRIELALCRGVNALMRDGYTLEDAMAETISAVAAAEGVDVRQVQQIEEAMR